MKKMLSGALAFVMCFNVLFFSAACDNNGDEDEKGDTSPKETVIDFDTSKESASKYFSVEINASMGQADLVPYPSSSEKAEDYIEMVRTGTLTITVEPVYMYRMRFDSAYLEVDIMLPSNWKFAYGGSGKQSIGENKTISVSVSANGKGTATEAIKYNAGIPKLGLLFDNYIENQGAFTSCSYFSLKAHGKMTIYNE